MKIGFIGCGNMGGAMLTAMLKQFSRENFTIIVQNEEEQQLVQNKYKVIASCDFNDLKSVDIILLAVKPQSLPEIAFRPNQQQIIISILAGTNLATLSKHFSTEKIVRAMPNLGQIVEAGMTGAFANWNNFSAKEKDIIQQLLSCGSNFLQLQNENEINAITALSGSGPAYFFEMLAAFISAGENLGFSQEISRQIALQTGQGALQILQNFPDISAEEWAEKVTSKGGTTAAARQVLAQEQWTKTLQKAISSAHQRAEELS
jgi:pyrroline-5-carboxylate reductase